MRYDALRATKLRDKFAVLSSLIKGSYLVSSSSAIVAVWMSWILQRFLRALF